MQGLRRLRPSPAMVVACVALFVAGAGTATAAKLITGKQIKNGTITSRDVRNGSLLGKDFKSGQLARGPQGLPGASGRAGRDGFGVLSYHSGLISLAAANPGDDDEGSAFVPCPAGQYPTGGDAYATDPKDPADPTDDVIVSGVVNGEFFFFDEAGTPNSWAVDATNTKTIGVDVVIEVICANATQPPPPVAKAKTKAPAGIREARPVE